MKFLSHSDLDAVFRSDFWSENSFIREADSEAQGFVEVEVPETYRTPPFDRERMLKVPEGAKVSVLTRVEKGSISSGRVRRVSCWFLNRAAAKFS